MSDQVLSEATAADPATPTAGFLLRQARQARGLHIAALAASIKVSPQKLEFLEADRVDQLPDASFARALAQTVCRALGVDAVPVLSLLPPSAGQGLEQMGSGLNTPFHDRPGSRMPDDQQFVRNALVAGAAVLAMAALAVYMLPSGWVDATFHSESTPITVPTDAEIVTPVVPAPAKLMGPVEEATKTPVKVPAVAPAASVAAVGAAGAVQLRTSGKSWVEVVDGRGSVLLSRLLQSGANLGVNGSLPMQVKIGNADVTTVLFKGREIELLPSSNRVASLELK